jgi:predicted aspartyl protease
MTGLSDARTVIIPMLNVSTAGATRIEAPILAAQDLGSAGLLGIDTLRHHAVVIDFDTNSMTVRSSRKRASWERPEPGEIIVRARSLLGQLVVTDAYYRGRRVRVVLDTGSVVTMGNGALRKRAGEHAAPGQPISLISVTGDTLVANYSQIGDIQVGPVRFHNLPVAFADAPPFERFGLTDQPAILLGMDALRQFRRVEIDFANREVRFTMPRDAS